MRLEAIGGFSPWGPNTQTKERYLLGNGIETNVTGNVFSARSWRPLSSVTEVATPGACHFPVSCMLKNTREEIQDPGCRMQDADLGSPFYPLSSLASPS